MNLFRTLAVGLVAAALLTFAPATPASAGSSCQYIVTNAVLSAAQWNSCFQAKQNELGFTPINKAGDGMLGLLTTIAPTTSIAGFRLNPGVAPTVPVNGDIWTTSSGLYVRINGATVGPLTGGASGSFAATSPLTVTFPAGVVTYACATCVTSSGGGAITGTAPIAVSGAGVVSITGAAGQVLAGSPSAFTATPTLGASGTLGTLTFGNATSGLLTLRAVTGALGTVTVSLPAATDTLMGKATLDTMTNKTFDTAGSGNALSIAGVAVTANSGTGSMVRATAPTVSALVVTGSFTATGLVTNAALANPATTVNGQTCTLGSTCTVTAVASSIAVGTTAISGGTTTRILFDNAGVVGEYTISGTGSVAMTAAPAFTGAVTAAGSIAVAGCAISSNVFCTTGSVAISSTLTSAAHTVTSAAAAALAVGLNGATNPALLVDASTASSATGIRIKSAAAAAGVAVSVITSGTNENLTIDAAGSGTITLGGTSTGAIVLTRAATLSAALTYGGVTLSNSVTGTGAMVLATAPTVSALTVTGSFTATGLVGNAALVNASTTVNGQVCTLGSTCTIVAAAGSIATGTTTITGGTTTRVLFNNAGVLGEYVITGTGNVAMSASPTFTGTLSAAAGAFSSTLTSTAHTITSAAAAALAVGPAGATSPSFLVDASTASAATGLRVKSAAAAGGLAVSVITSGTNENLTIDAAGSGTITLGGTSTGSITLTRATTMSAALTYGGVTLSNAVTGTGSMVLSVSPTLTGTLAAAAANFSGAVTGASFGATGAHVAFNATSIPAGGTTGTGYLFSSTANFGLFFGSGVPTLSAAQGSLYLRSDGAPYYNNNGTTGWTSLASGSGTVTSITASTGLTGGVITGVGTIAVDVASAANLWAGTASKIPDAATLFNAAGALTSCTGTSTAACDFAAGFNFTFTATTATNYTLANPSNSTKVGQTGCIYLVQPASGTVVTIAFGSNWKSAGGSSAYALTATLGAVDRVCYIVRTSTFIDFTFANNIN